MKINPTPHQKLERNIDRIKTLRVAISQSNNDKQKASLNKELKRRLGEVKAVSDLVKGVIDET